MFIGTRKTLDETKLVKKAFNTLVCLHNSGYNNWISKVYNVLNNNEISIDHWANQNWRICLNVNLKALLFPIGRLP